MSHKQRFDMTDEERREERNERDHYHNIKRIVVTSSPASLVSSAPSPPSQPLPARPTADAPRSRGVPLVDDSDTDIIGTAPPGYLQVWNAVRGACGPLVITVGNAFLRFLALTKGGYVTMGCGIVAACAAAFAFVAKRQRPANDNTEATKTAATSNTTDERKSPLKSPKIKTQSSTASPESSRKTWMESARRNKVALGSTAAAVLVAATATLTALKLPTSRETPTEPLEPLSLTSSDPNTTFDTPGPNETWTPITSTSLAPPALSPAETAPVPNFFADTTPAIPLPSGSTDSTARATPMPRFTSPPPSPLSTPSLTEAIPLPATADIVPSRAAFASTSESVTSEPVRLEPTRRESVTLEPTPIAVAPELPRENLSSPSLSPFALVSETPPEAPPEMPLPLTESPSLTAPMVAASSATMEPLASPLSSPLSAPLPLSDAPPLTALSSVNRSDSRADVPSIPDAPIAAPFTPPPTETSSPPVFSATPSTSSADLVAPPEPMVSLLAPASSPTTSAIPPLVYASALPMQANAYTPPPPPIAASEESPEVPEDPAILVASSTMASVVERVQSVQREIMNGQRPAAVPVPFSESGDDDLTHLLPRGDAPLTVTPSSIPSLMASEIQPKYQTPYQAPLQAFAPIQNDVTSGESAVATEPRVGTFYRAQSGDNFWTIADKAYGSPKWYRDLAVYNRDRVSNAARIEGAVIEIPTLDVLQRSVSQSTTLLPATTTNTSSQERFAPTLPLATTPTATTRPSRTFAPPPAGSFIYIVQPGETLDSIAETKLGHRSRATEIVRLNLERIRSDGTLLAGTEIVLPRPQSNQAASYTRRSF